jgi:hypothetical protein
MGLVKLLKKSHQKLINKNNSVTGVMTLEEQVCDLNERLKEQERELR